MTEMTTKIIRRKFRVCAKKKCIKCPLEVRDVPEDCEWMMKHILSCEGEGLVVHRARRSGKTTEIMEAANQMIEAGYNVIILVPRHEMAMNIQRMMMGTGVRILSTANKTALSETFYGLPESVVFSDEVGSWVAKAVERDNKHEFVLGYQTK